MVKENMMKQTEIGLLPEDWEVVELSELSSKIASGKSNTVNNENGIYPIYGSTGIIGIKNYYDYEGEKITVARVGANAGYINIIDGKYCISDNTLFVQSNDKIILNFLYKYLQSINLNKYVFGSGQPLITGTILKNLLIPLPPLLEQEAIAEALSDADVWIESLEQLIDKKRLIKQGAMQELLSPKEDWEVKKLGEVGKCLRGVSYSGETDLYESETEKTIRLLRSNNIYNSKVVLGNIQNVNRQKVKEHQIIKLEDILVCMANGSKELVGKAGFCDIKVSEGLYTFGAFMGVFRILDGFDRYFIYMNFLTKNYRNYIDLLLSGSSINNLKPSDIEQIEIKIPFLTEQTRIATILSDMDAELEALEAQLGKARKIKQGMMQELLTGRVRLV